MSTVQVSAEALLAAPAAIVYHCIADYREHHRPSGFLPPAFTSLEALEGGVGAGTLIRFSSRFGGRTQTMTQRVSEPEPGRVLVEDGDGVRTVFTVEPAGNGCRVRIVSDFTASGLQGAFMRLFLGRILRPLYADELSRLERYAQAHGPLPAPQAVGSSVGAPSQA